MNIKEYSSEILSAKTILENRHDYSFEHVTIYLVSNALITDVTKVSNHTKKFFRELNLLRRNSDSRRIIRNNTEEYITTNLIVLAKECPNIYDSILKDYELPDWLQQKETDFHEKRISVKIVGNMGILLNLKNAFSCVSEINNESDDLFFLDNKNFFKSKESYLDYLEVCQQAYNKYKRMIERGESKEIAKQILNLGTCVTSVQTGFRTEWLRFFMKCKAGNDSVMKFVNNNLYDKFLNEGLV